MHRFGRTQQDRADGDIAAGRCFEQVVGDVGCVDIGHDQQVGVALQRAVGHERGAGLAV